MLQVSNLSLFLKSILIAHRFIGMILVSLMINSIAVHISTAANLPLGFSEKPLASGLQSPTAMAIAPDGRIFICQQGGQIRVVKNGALLTTPFATIAVNAVGEAGVLGIAFDPNFAVNQYIYLYYTSSSPSIHNRVSRFTANGDISLAGSEQVILELDNLSSASNHNGGAMHFGADGKLYIAVGDNATSANAQSLNNKLGKILRINADGSIPADNPFISQTTGSNQAIWALGLRNPYTFAFQPTIGRMFINDVGLSLKEEINDGFAGANYGWPNCEGPCVPTNSTYRDPLFNYGHLNGTCAITGGTFYNPTISRFTANFVGQYFYMDYCAGWLNKLDPTNLTSTTFATGLTFPVDLAVDNNGYVYYLQRGTSANSGQLVRIDYPQQPASDYNADGKSDILWRNTSTGDNYLYLMNGSNVNGAAINTNDPVWQIKGKGDYNGDGKADILWRNGTSGANYVYLMNGSVVTSGIDLGTVADPEWQIVGNGDFNADGKTDIFWRNSTTGVNYIYQLNVTGFTAVYLNTINDKDWVVKGTADYNGDGKADILWRNVTSGANYIYFMNGSAIASAAPLNTVADPAWDIKGSGDYNGDGKADILWRNSSNGANYLYLMNGATITTAAPINSVTDKNWEIKGSGDYNGDGKADILWRQVVTGDNYVYFMSSASITNSSAINKVNDTNWQIMHIQ